MNLTHRPFAGLVPQTGLSALGYEAPAQQQKPMKKGDKTSEEKPSSSSTSSTSHGGIMTTAQAPAPAPATAPATAPVANTAKKAAAAAAKPPQEETAPQPAAKTALSAKTSLLVAVAVDTLDIVVDDGVRPFIRGATFGAGAILGVVLAGNGLARTGLKVPGFSG